MCMTPDCMYLLLGMKDGSLQAVGKNPSVAAGATASRLFQKITRFTLFPRAASSLISSLNTDLSSSTPAHTSTESTSEDSGAAGTTTTTTTTTSSL